LFVQYYVKRNHAELCLNFPIMERKNIRFLQLRVRASNYRHIESIMSKSKNI